MYIALGSPLESRTGSSQTSSSQTEVSDLETVAGWQRESGSIAAARAAKLRAQRKAEEGRRADEMEKHEKQKLIATPWHDEEKWAAVNAAVPAEIRCRQGRRQRLCAGTPHTPVLLGGR